MVAKRGLRDSHRIASVRVSDMDGEPLRSEKIGGCVETDNGSVPSLNDNSGTGRNAWKPEPSLAQSIPSIEIQ